MAAPPHPPTPDFDSWVAARAHTLSRFAYALTGEEDEADEVVQEALAAAHAHWHRTDDAEPAEEDLQVTMVRAYLRRARRGRRRTLRADPVDTDLAAEDVIAAGDTDASDPWLPTPAFGGGPGPDQTALWQRCAGLTAPQRAALVLHTLEGLGTAEIAAVMGRRHRTAETALAQAVAQLPSAADRTRPVPRREAERAALAAAGLALQQYAELAPRPYAPADRAARRSRHDRRRRIAVAATVAAVLVVPLTWALTQEPAEELSSPAAQAEPMTYRNWRWESWGGAQVLVPRSWGHGDLTQWCTRRGPSGPAVDRPEIDSTDALCSLHDNGRPTYTGGLVFRKAGSGLRISRADVAPYASTRLLTVGAVTITLVDIDRAVGNAIIASAERVDRRDFNGCTPHLGDSPARGAMSALVDVDSVSVCRYGLTGWKRPTLISSRRLEGRDADEVLHGVRHAPVGPPTSAAQRCRRDTEELATLVLWDHGRPTTAVLRYDGCDRHGLTDGEGHRQLTGEVLAPVLVPPWTGELTRDVRRSMAPHGAHPDPEDSIRPAAPGGRLTSGGSTGLGG